MKTYTCRGYVLVCLFLGTTLSFNLSAAQQIALNPSSLNFGSISPGSGNTLTVQITNITAGKISIRHASVSGTGYSISGIVCPIIIRAGQSASFSVTFTPPTAGLDSGNVSLVTETWDGWRDRGLPSTVVLALSGSGLGSGQIGASPGSEGFGNVMVGNSQTLPATVMNSGTASLTIAQAAMSNAAYTVSGLNPPVTLAAGQSLTLSLIHI